MSATSGEGTSSRASFVLGLVRTAQKSVDLVATQRPVVVEIGDDLFHERFAEANRARAITEVVHQDRERELLRAFTLVGPFEAVFGEALDLVVLIEGFAVYDDDQPVDGAFSLVGLHGRHTETVARVKLAT